MEILGQLIHILSTSFPFLFGLNGLDIIILLVCLVYSVEGYFVGFITSFFDLVSFILSFLLGLKFYSFLASFVTNQFGVSHGFASAASFFIVAFISEILLNLLLRRAAKFFLDRVNPLGTPGAVKANQALGVLPGLASALIILSFLLTLIIALPLSPILKHLISTSRIGNNLVSRTQGAEKNLNGVFGGAIKDTLNFLTVEPGDNESIALHFKTTDVSIDQQAEQVMLGLVNKERVSRGIAPLTLNEHLQAVARSHSKDMFKRGYFSHNTPDGLTPFDRMASADITYTYAGENLALAPNVDLAHQGLMQSPGHKRNILDPHFKQVGIGVIDGGVYGEMFSQEFTD